MCVILRRLDFLCIETIGINIEKFKKIPKDKWQLRYCNNLGERLILAANANSKDGGIDEDSYKFILGNFIVKNLLIANKTCKNVRYFNFLNSKNFDELEVDCSKEMLLENTKNFHLKTNKLKIIIDEDRGNIETDGVFLSSLFAEKELVINVICNKSKNENVTEDIVLTILSNSSKKMETLTLTKRTASKKFLDKFMVTLQQRKHLRALHLDFCYFFCNTHVARLFESSLTNLKSFTLSPFTNNWAVKTLIECFKSLTSLQELKIWFSDEKITNEFDDIKLFFSFLESKDLKCLKDLEIHLPDDAIQAKVFCHFLTYCYGLEKINIVQRNYEFKKGEDFFNSLLSSAASLKCIILQRFEFKNENDLKSLKYVLRYSKIQTVSFVNIKFKNGSFKMLLEGLNHLQDSMISLKFIHTEISEGELKILPKYLKKFKKLNEFQISNNILTEKILREIFHSLQSSSETLGKVVIFWKNHLKKLEKCDELFNLLIKCEKLSIINIDILIVEEKVEQLLCILRKFQDVLEDIDLSFCHASSKINSLANFLYGCPKLKAISGFRVFEIEGWDKIIDSLKNSRYCLERAPYFDSKSKSILNQYPKWFA